MAAINQLYPLFLIWQQTHKDAKRQPEAIWYYPTALPSDEFSSSQYTAISVEWEVTVSHARTASKCQVATAESLAVSVM